MSRRAARSPALLGLLSLASVLVGLASPPALVAQDLTEPSRTPVPPSGQRPPAAEASDRDTPPPPLTLESAGSARVASPSPGAPDATRLGSPSPGAPDATRPAATTGTPDARTDGRPPAAAVSPVSSTPTEDPLRALDHPLSPEQTSELETLAAALGARAIATRERAAAEIRARLGARAASALLELSLRERDPERRFRERALVSSLVFDWYLTHASDCGWLGVRWVMAGTSRHPFSAHVVEALPGHPAAEGGVLPGDEVVGWQGQELGGQGDFIDRVQATPPGTRVALTVERQGRDLVLHVDMGTRIDPAGNAELPYETFRRDMASRKLEAWLAAWRARRAAR